MENELISVIVAAYNAEKNIERCLDSLVAQTYRNMEIVVIDDASTDSTLKICRQYADKYHCIKIIHREKNSGGPCEVWNNGLDAATGAYIGFCDSDDWVEPDMYECLYNTLKKNGTDISVCGWFLETEWGMDVSYRKYAGFTKVFSEEEALQDMFTVWQSIEGYNWNKLSKRELFDGLRFDASVYMFNDMIMSYGLIKGHSVAYVDRQLYHYIIYSQSVTHASFKEWYWSGIEGMEKMYHDVPKDYVRCREKLADRIVRTTIYMSNNANNAHLFTKATYKRVCEIMRIHRKEIKGQIVLQAKMTVMLSGYYSSKYAMKVVDKILKIAGKMQK